MDLHQLGWDARFQAGIDELDDHELIPARVTRQERKGCRVLGSFGEADARFGGRLRAARMAPVAGDWVALRRDALDGWTVEAVLPRRTRFSRRRPGGEADEQVVAANVDVALLVLGPEPDFSLPRLDRYLALAHEGGARPVVLLTKADLLADVDARVAQVRSRAAGVPVLALSATQGTGMDALRALLAPARTHVVLGSSGVGKSTLLNALLGEARMRTASVREADGRGRHTTTQRELVPLPGGALLLDTPGMRELGLWSDGSGLDAAFADVASLAQACRFRDCRHEREPGCAVRGALEAGLLDEARLASWRKLEREAAHLARRRSEAGKAEERRQARAFGRMGRDAQVLKRWRLDR